MSRCPKCHHQMGWAYECLECKKRAKVKTQNGPKPLDRVFQNEVMGQFVNNGFKMPFGKHRGEYIEKVPKAYLEWLEEELLLNKNNPDMLARITKELKRRK